MASGPQKGPGAIFLFSVAKESVFHDGRACARLGFALWDTLRWVPMGFINTFTASGQGSLSLGGVQDVNEVAAVVVTFADLARIVGTSPVRRVHQQGWYGIGVVGSTGPAAPAAVIQWWKFIQLESETMQFGAFNHVAADTLFWDIDPGGVMYLEVDWP